MHKTPFVIVLLFLVAAGGAWLVWADDPPVAPTARETLLEDYFELG